ncbi:MAG: hypothetical protein Kow0090_13300 [Myxococcota bacterium]
MIFGRHKKHIDVKKGQGTVNVNVIPMIDMFMVLNVFLLMQNAVASFALFQSPELRIPNSYSEDEISYSSEVAVTANAVYLEGKLVEPTLKEYAENDIPELPGLSDGLAKRKEELVAAGRVPEGSSEAGAGFPVMLRADQDLPFKLVQKVMYTCNRNGFDQIEFAVIKRSEMTSAGGFVTGGTGGI